MKILPDSPDLDHLRQQAKDLLAGLRDTSPTTTLHDAQASLAQQYGFEGWSELKAEVDRRRGGAAQAPPELAAAIASRFGLGEVTGGMRSVARADEVGRPWSLRTSAGRWSVRSVENWWPIVDVSREIDLQTRAAAAGVQLPEPVLSLPGNVVEEIEGQRWRVTRWRHSGPPMAAPASAAVTRTVGGILATLHGLQLPVDRISPWSHRLLSGESWPSLLERARQAPWAAELAHILPTLVGFGAVGADASEPSPVLTHNALGPGQVRRGEGGSLVVTGWEHAGGQPPAWEICDALVHWTVDPHGGVNVAAARCLVDGYADVAGSLPGIGLASFRGAVTGLGNYVHGQVCTALAATDEEDRRFLDRSIRHLLTHLPTMSTLEELLAATDSAATVA